VDSDPLSGRVRLLKPPTLEATYANGSSLP
jgi:hypothetical protein